MQINFRLPSLGADMESAILTEWLKKPGDPIRRGEALAVVETAKGLIDIESFEEGTVAKLLVGPGTTVPVGAVLAHIESVSAESAPPAVPSVGVPGAALASAAEGLTTPAPERMSQTDSSLATTRRRPVSPAARRRADELGITLAALEQASPGGVIHIADVEKLAARELPDRHRAMRTSIGTAMARSKREIPHYYLGHTVDFGTARAWLQRYNSQVPVAERLIEGVLLLKAVALTAAQCFGFNGYFRDGHFEPATAVHLGTAIALRGGGLVAPALLDANRKDLATLMREFSDLVTRVRSGHMRSGEFATATLTVTSLGSDGADVLYPIINPPQVAIVGAGAVTERPWVCNGTVVVRPILTLSVAGDHRVTDGRAGSRFIRTVARLLESPETL